MAKGTKTGGRQVGSANRITGLAKDNIAAVFNRMGGTAAMAKWAKANPTDFYKLYARLVPVQLTGEGGGPIETKNTWNLMPVSPNADKRSGS